MISFDIYNPYANQSVTDYYVDAIKDALERCGYNTRKINKISRADRSENIVIVYPPDYIKAKLAGYKKVLLWVQGISPEESYMRNRNKLRRFVLSLKEIPGIFLSDMIIMVSERMKEHYEKKYGVNFKDKLFFMPCFNAELDKTCFSTEDKYTKNTFTYTGGIAVWQCFEQAARLYSEVEKILPDCQFKVYTPDKEDAEKILKGCGAENYSIDFVSVDQLAEELKAVKYGFVLREENIVNLVATPTKLSTYMSSGVIPIFSECLADFTKATKDMKYVVPMKGFGAEEFLEKCPDVDAQDIEKEYSAFFDGYYSLPRYLSEMTEYIKKHMA